MDMRSSSDPGVDLGDSLVAFERGELCHREVVALFQRLIDDGTVWGLQGFYGRTAMALIRAGFCMLGPEPHRDYFGNHVPSRSELPPGAVGSREYRERMRSEQPPAAD